MDPLVGSFSILQHQTTTPYTLALDPAQARAIEVLLKNGVTVICTGGGGIPVILEDAPGGGKRRCGIEAVRAQKQITLKCTRLYRNSAYKFVTYVIR